MRVRFPSLLVFPFFVAALLSLAGGLARSGNDPWTAADTIQPKAFVKELKDAKSPPTILFVGFRRLYASGHIHGAQFHGSAGSEEGLKELKAWVASLPRSTSLVIYCGCCPMERCPNIRPGFTALRELGFTKVRVLVLPESFAVDWAEKELPYDKGE